MTTLRGAMRSYGATVRRMERTQQRNARESAKRFKEQQKLEEIGNAQQAVSDWEDYVKTIQSIHKNCTEPVNWELIKNEEKPIKPVEEFKHETLAKTKLDNFKPSFFDKIFGSTQKKRDRLTEALKQAKLKDKKENDLKNSDYLNEIQNWRELIDISIGIENKDVKAYKDALQYFNPFSDIGELGTKISFNFEKNHIDIDLHINSFDIIPDYILSQTSTGKLSKKSMPKTRFNELYQDYVCSSILRVAREVFAYLPIEYARINAMSQIVNSKTGYLEEQAIISTIIPPSTINQLKLETIDPSDSMQNFVHNMSFNKTKGFSIVEKVELKK